MIYGNKFLDKEIQSYQLHYDNFFNLFPDLITESTEASYQEFVDILNEAEETKEIDPDEGYGADLRPVFIVLLYSDSTFDHVVEKFVKDQSYWHAAISFGPALSHCYSFNFGEANANKFKGGLSFENLQLYQTHDTGTMEVNCIFLDKEKFKELKEALNYYIKNKEKTRYSFINLLYSLFGKKTKNGLKPNLVCSTFVDTILKSVNVDLNRGKQTNLVKPDDLKKKKENKKQFKVFEGKIIKYNVEKVKKKVEELASNLKNNFFGSDDKEDKKKDKRKS